MIRALAITGPTASGKTALSLSVAKHFDGEIISCDSMQIYREMDIGTAKATREEQAMIPHHLIDIISPLESYSAQNYRSDAIECAKEIVNRGKLPVFVGGTGLYIDSVIRPISSESPESNSEYREKILQSIKNEDDVAALWKRLWEVDPESAEKIHKNNIQRVIRALEIYDTTGKPKSLIDKESLSIPSEVDVKMITIDFHDRENLYERVNKRVDLMVEEGLIEEVKGLYDRGLLAGKTASQAIGYKEIVEFIEGKCSLCEAVDKLKISTRRYAKRQLTWFRHERDAVTIYADTECGRLKSADELISEAIEICRNLISK